VATNELHAGWPVIRDAHDTSDRGRIGNGWIYDPRSGEIGVRRGVSRPLGSEYPDMDDDGQRADTRIYHSTALLLPDGRVLVAGGGRDWARSSRTKRCRDLFSPLFVQRAAPTITSAPATAQYSSSFVVQTPDAANITSVALVGMGAETHALNMNQRYVPLSFQQTAGGLVVQSPLTVILPRPGITCSSW